MVETVFIEVLLLVNPAWLSRRAGTRTVNLQSDIVRSTEQAAHLVPTLQSMLKRPVSLQKKQQM